MVERDVDSSLLNLVILEAQGESGGLCLKEKANTQFKLQFAFLESMCGTRQERNFQTARQSASEGCCGFCFRIDEGLLNVTETCKWRNGKEGTQPYLRTDAH